MKKALLINFLLFLAGVLIAAIAGEVLFRVFWKNAPMGARAKNDSIMMQSADIGEGRRYIPNSKGFWWGTQVSINSQGLRDREFPPERKPGTTRILVLGDSFMFGIGVPPEKTFPKFLEKILNESGGGARYEVINGGVAGHNFNQEVVSLKRLAPHYRPDIVIVSLIYNDTELHGFSDFGWTPVLDNHQKGNFPKPNPVFRLLFKLMLPAEEQSFSERLRYFFANHSRMYLFLALSFRTPYMKPSHAREMAQFKTPACQNELLLWWRFRENLEELKRMGAERGFKPVIVFYTDLFMEGYPYRRMREAVEASGLPFLDLSYLWKDRNTYVRKYSLKWDFHPSAYSLEIAADAAAGFLADGGFVHYFEGLKAKFDPTEYAKTDKQREKLHRRVEKEQEEEFRALAEKFTSEVDFGKKNPHPDQLLYGWWEEEFSKAVGVGGVRWGAIAASIIVKNPGNGGELIVEGVIPRGVIEKIGVPNVTVEIGCGAPRAARPAEGGKFSIGVPIPERLAGKRLLEVNIGSDIIAKPELMGMDPKDQRAVGFGLRRIGWK